jgi:hypothetical protein
MSGWRSHLVQFTQVVGSFQQPVTHNIKSAETDVVDDHLAAAGGNSGRGLSYPNPMLKTSNVVAMGTPNRVPAWRAPLSKNSAGSKDSHPSPSM